MPVAAPETVMGATTSAQATFRLCWGHARLQRVHELVQRRIVDRLRDEAEPRSRRNRVIQGVGAQEDHVSVRMGAPEGVGQLDAVQTRHLER